MISKAIVDELKGDTTLMTAVGSGVITAEIGGGDKTVVVKAFTPRRVDAAIPEIKVANVQVLVSGYAIASGETISERVVALIEGLEADDITDGDRTYHVNSVITMNEPELITWQELKTFSSNFRVFYRQED